MRQKGDDRFINLLNRMREGKFNNDDLTLLANRKCLIETLDSHCTVLYAENEPKNEYNHCKLELIPFPPITIPAKDSIPHGGPANI